MRYVSAFFTLCCFCLGGLFGARAEAIPPLAVSKASETHSRVSVFSGPDRPLLIYFEPGITKEEAEQSLQQLGLKIEREHPFPLQPVFIISAPGKQGFENLVRLPYVFSVWPAPPPRTTCNVNAQDTINTDTVHAAPYGLDGSGEIVGVWDQLGVRTSHQEFGGRVTQVDGESPAGHATHVTGTVCAAGVDPDAVGAAPGAAVWAHSYDNDTREWWDARSSITSSNHSYTNYVGWQGTTWWGPGDMEEDPYFGKYTPEAYEWDAMIHRTNVLAVRAAGNERLHTGTTGAHSHSGSGTYYCFHKSDDWWSGGYDTVAWAAAAKNVMTVGAINEITADPYTDGDVNQVKWTSWGPTDDGRLKPDLVADGGILYSTTSSSDTAYQERSGTSMAAPCIAGSAALLAQQYKSYYPEAPDAVLLKTWMIHTAHDVGNPGPDYQYGWGVADIRDAADLMETDGGSSEYLFTGSISEGTVQYYLSLTQAEELKVTLSWFDPEGQPNTGGLNDPTPALVNDLDLLLLSPDGTPFYPWTLDRTQPWLSAVRTTSNKVDNTEQVYVPETESSAGTWTLQVQAHDLPVAPQDFAVVTSHPITPCTIQSSWTGWESGYPVPASDCGHIALAWQEVEAQCGESVTYRIHRDTSPGFTPSAGNRIAEGLETLVYDDGSLVPGTTYYYRVIPVEGGLEGTASPETPVTAGEGTDADPPADLLGFSVSPVSGCGDLTLAWDASEEHCSPPVVYRVYRDTSPDVAISPTHRIGWTTGTTFRDGAIPMGATVYYRVSASDQAGNVSTPSVEVSWPVPSGEIVDFQEDMEGDLSGWSTGGDWEEATCAAHSGIRSLSLDLIPCVTYPGESTSHLTSPEITIDPVNPPEHLTFWHRFGSEENWDSGEVLIDHDSDDTFSSLTTFTGPVAEDWREVKIGLTSFSGWASPVRVRFTFLSDILVQNGKGWQVDDVVLTHPGTTCTGCTPPGEVTNVKCLKESDSIRCTWDAESGSTRYKVLSLGGADFDQSEALQTVTETQYLHDAALLLSQNLYYRVHGIDACGVEGP